MCLVLIFSIVRMMKNSGVNIDMKPQVRNTKQKTCIQKIFQEAIGPLSISEIYALASKDVKGIGLATVYRVVGGLVDSGEIKKVNIPNAVEDVRYERSDTALHHHHFFCTKCNKTFDLTKCPMASDLNKFVLPGFKVDAHELTLYGLCADCHGKK